ncbi:hypothetical protein CVD28_02570 [Bacillus sp. M6-12]|uniref:hypothetical protein n=1 Tax=Bacillus sp. M6-12 TaxID=2054166 RepID=UPI000C76089D|nr:hypothetical protein [Bacillus sp. M6-12]PLS19316.1 hypothetical protein CVD28_02570 [Bacillus sp. M6-12]
MTYIISYKLKGDDKVRLARLNANGYSEAVDKAEEGIKIINDRFKEYNQQFELVTVTSLESLENWEV